MTDPPKPTESGPTPPAAVPRLAPHALVDRSPEAEVVRNSVRQRLFGGPPTVFQLDRFIITDRLGAGGMGVVFEAYDPKLERKIALKVLHPVAEREGEVARERMLREARALARLSHPNVVPVFEVGEHEGGVFIAMELVRGQSLLDHARAPGRSPRQIFEIFEQAARGLAAAHREGLVHRDFKPSNGLVGEDGRVRVLDFGLARTQSTVLSPDPTSPERQPGEDDGSLTKTGALVGTPAYMAPEQRRGEPATAASDQYSLCVSLYEALTGALPPKPTPSAPLPPAALARCPRAVRPILARGLALDPDERWPSMQAVVDALGTVRGRKRRGLVWLSAVGMTTAVLTTVLWPRPSPCAAASDEIWSDDRRETVDAALQDTSATLAPRVVDALDDYATEWNEARVEACEAHHVRHQTSAVLFDRAMLCLDRRRRAVDSLTERLVSLDPQGSTRALAAVDSLPAVQPCDDHERLLSERGGPADPVEAEALAQIQARLDQANIAESLGDLDQAIALSEEAARRAAGLEHRVLEARALQLVGVLRRSRSELQPAIENLDRALWLAEAGGDDELVAWTSSELASAYALQGDADEVHAQARRTEAAIARLGRPTLADMVLSDARGTLAQAEGRFRDAEAHFMRALELAEALPDTSPAVVGARLVELASIVIMLSDLPRAAALLERARRLQEDALGPLHVTVLSTRFHLASITLGSGDLEGAERQLLDLLDTAARSMGARSRLAGAVHGNLNIVYTRAERLPEAIEHAERSVEILGELFGPSNAQLLIPLMNLAETYDYAGRDADARATLERTIDIGRATAGGGADLGSSLLSLAVLELKADQPEAALRRAREAAPMMEAAIGEGPHEELSRLHLVIGDAHQALGQLDEAEAEHRRSLALAPAEHPARARAHLGIAELLAEKGHEAEAVDEARRGLVVAQQIGDDARAERIERWLAERSAPPTAAAE